MPISTLPSYQCPCGERHVKQPADDHEPRRKEGLNDGRSDPTKPAVVRSADNRGAGRGSRSSLRQELNGD